jgi:hypothetical protein
MKWLRRSPFSFFSSALRLPLIAHDALAGKLQVTIAGRAEAHLRRAHHSFAKRTPNVAHVTSQTAMRSAGSFPGSIAAIAPGRGRMAQAPDEPRCRPAVIGTVLRSSPWCMHLRKALSRASRRIVRSPPAEPRRAIGPAIVDLPLISRKLANSEARVTGQASSFARQKPPKPTRSGLMSDRCGGEATVGRFGHGQAAATARRARHQRARREISRMP